MESLDKLSSQKCPLCSKSLASKEYKQAISQLEEKLEKNFEQKKNHPKRSGFSVLYSEISSQSQLIQNQL